MRLLDDFSQAGAVRLTGVLVVAVALTACCVGVSSASAAAVVNTIPVGDPYGVSSDGTHVWVTNYGGTVSEIDASTGTVVNTIPVAGAGGISSDGTHVWVTGSGGTVSEIDAATGTVVQTIPVSGGADGISSDGTHVWATNSGDDTVSEIGEIGAPAPTITNLSVRSGPIAGKTPVVVTGSGFGNPGDPDTVTFVPEGGGDPIPASNVVVVSDTEIELTTPDVSADLPGGGVLHTNVQVTANGQVSTFGDASDFNFPITIVEMGDSVAAGEGTLYGYGYDPDTGLWGGGDSSPTWAGTYQDCHDSGYAYGQILSGALGSHFVNLACTGATFENGIVGPEVFPHTLSSNVTVPAQFDSTPYTEAEPDAVIATYGADDVKFVEIVEACIKSDLASAIASRQCVPTNPGSTVQSDFFDHLAALTSSYGALATTVEQLGNSAAPPRVPKIIFTDYMDPLPPSGGCNDTWPLTDEQVAYLNTLLGMLNKEIRPRCKT
jgi:hypothetical protein